MIRTVLLAALAALAANGRAETICTVIVTSPTVCSDIPTTGTMFETGSGLNLNGYNPAISITPSASGYITEVDFVASAGELSDLMSNPQLAVSIDSDNSGAPGSTLATQTFSVGEVEGSTMYPPTITQWILSSPVAITDGVPFWLAFSSSDDVVWNTNDGGAFGDSENTGGGWVTETQTIGAFSIEDGSTMPEAPEPGTFGLLGCAAVVGAFLRRQASPR